MSLTANAKKSQENKTSRLVCFSYLIVLLVTTAVAGIPISFSVISNLVFFSL